MRAAHNASTDPPVKDETHERPVPAVWRPTIEQVVQCFVAGDFDLAGGVPGVDPVSPENAKQIRDYVHGYGASLVPLEEQTWETSVAMWMLSHWEVLVDLRTEEEGRSDLALHLKVYEQGDRFRYVIGLVYVP